MQGHFIKLKIHIQWSYFSWCENKLGIEGETEELRLVTIMDIRLGKINCFFEVFEDEASWRNDLEP